MALTLITGPANCGKARAVLDAVRAHAANAREPLLVVPTAADANHYRRELAQDGLVFGTRVVRFSELIDTIAAATASVPPALGPVARERIVAVVAQRAPLRALREVSTTAGFVSALTALVAQLGAQRVTPARWAGALRAWATEDPRVVDWASDLRVLYDGYERALSRVGRPDAERRAAGALDALAREPAGWRNRPVCFYGFDDLTTLQLEAIDTLARIVDAPVTVSLAYEAGRVAFAGRAGAFQTLRPLAAEHIALPARDEHYAPGARAALHHLERGLFEPDPPPPGDAAGAIGLAEAGGERAELELMAGEIAALLDEGVPAGEIAIVSHADAELLDEVLTAYGIPHTHQRRVPFASTGVGRGLLALLRCALTEADATELLAWLRTPGVLERPQLADRLEAQLLARGVTSADAARTLWEADHWPLHALARVRESEHRGAALLIGVVAGEMARLLAAPVRRIAHVMAAGEQDEARAVVAAGAALDELAGLAASAPDLGVDGAALVALIAQLQFTAGEAPRADAVAVVDALGLRARRVRVLFVCGAQEGALPSPAPAQPVLSIQQRDALARASGLVLEAREDHVAAERYLFYATVSRPQQQLHLSWHNADDEGAPMSPSLFVDDVCDLFDARLRAQRRRRALGAAAWAGRGAPSAAAGARERALQGPRHAPAPIASLSDERVLAPLQGEEAVWSASGLETYAGCPARWFVQRHLRLRGLEPDPEPITRGALAHAVLEATLVALRERTGSARLGPERLGLARVLARTALRELEGNYQLSAAPERVPGARRRLEADLERYLEHAAQTSCGGLEPRHLELSFGFADSEWPALDLGEDVRVRGRIDRIDVGGNGEAVVYDYKGRNAPEPGRWLADNRFQLAVYMHAAERLLGLHAVGGFYQPLGIADLRGRGLLAREAELDLPCVNGDTRDEADLRELLDATLDAARAAAVAAREGTLAARPQGCGWLGRCEHPTICRSESS